MITNNNPLFLSKGFNIIKAFITPKDEFLTTELSKKSNMSWGHSQKIIKGLCDRGYLIKEKRKGRTRIIKLTEKGRAIWFLSKELEVML